MVAVEEVHKTPMVTQEDLAVAEAIQEDHLKQVTHHQQVHHKEIQEEMLSHHQNLVEVAEDPLLNLEVLEETLVVQAETEHLGQF